MCDPAACDQLLSNISSCLPPDQRSSYEGPISVSECLTALKGMAHGKAPVVMDSLWNSTCAFGQSLGDTSLVVTSESILIFKVKG